MVRIAITGGIACGKSLVGSFFTEEGVAVCDADNIAHRLMAPGQAVYRRVVRAFGPGILAPDNAIDRHQLAQRVFSEPRKRRMLDRIVHPQTRQAWEKWLAGQAQAYAAAVIVPLLYEANMAEGWHAVVCVSASETSQIHRLLARGLSESEAQQRIAGQMPVAEKTSLADYVIFNDGTMEILKQQTLYVLRSILET